MREWISGKVGHAWRAWVALVLRGKDDDIRDDKLRKFVKQMVRQWTSGKLAMAFRPWAAEVQRYREQQDKQRKFVTQMMRQWRSGKLGLSWRQWNFVAKHQARITKIASRWNNRRVLAGFKSWTLFAIAARGQQGKQRKFVERMARQWLATKLALAWRPWLNLVKSGRANHRQRHQHRAFRHAASQWRRGTVGAAFARLCEHARDISRSTSNAALRKALAELAALRAERAAQTRVASAEQEAELARHRQLLQDSAALASRQQAELEDQQAELEELRRFRDGYFQDELLGKQEVCATPAAAAAAAATLACACAMFALHTRRAYDNGPSSSALSLFLLPPCSSRYKAWASALLLCARRTAASASHRHRRQSISIPSRASMACGATARRARAYTAAHRRTFRHSFPPRPPP